MLAIRALAAAADPRLRLIGACAGALALAACVGRANGDPSFEGELSYDAYSSDADVAALRAGDSPAIVTAAWLVLGDVTFVDNNHCAQPENAQGHAGGLGASDHAPTEAARTRFWLPIGAYCGVRLPLLRAAAADTLPAEAPEALHDHSIVLEGELPARGARFTLASRVERTLDLNAEHGSFELGPDSARLLLGFDVARWLEGIDLGALEPDEQGTVSVSEDDNTDALQRFEHNLASGIDVFLDPDGEGTIEAAGTRIARGQ